MVQIGRVACIFTPFALTIASLVCIVLVFIAGSKQKNTALDDLYFFRADLSNFTSNPSTDLIPGTSVDDSLLKTGLDEAKKALNLKDYYTIYLWNYCAWDGKDQYSYCSPKQAEFWFNPVDVWGLNGTGVEALFPKELKDGLDAYHTASKWMFVAYVAALITTVLEIVVGVSAIFSRWGSFATTIVSTLSTVCLMGASIVATILFSTLAGSFNSVLKAYSIKATVGVAMLRVSWLAVAFSLGSGIFWFFSICCCSGRSPYGNRKDKRVRVEKTPYTYERVGSPNLGHHDNGSSVPLSNIGSRGNAGAYEPFRPQH